MVVVSSEKRCIFAPAFGSLAQLVQSAAFTRQRSLVQIQYVPRRRVTMWLFFFVLFKPYICVRGIGDPFAAAGVLASKKAVLRTAS